MFFTKSKQKEEPKVEEVKPISYTAIMEVTVINNRTDKEYTIKSENNLGLNWKIVGNNSDGICIQQITDIENDYWYVIARFTDFSTLKMVRQTFKIE